MPPALAAPSCPVSPDSGTGRIADYRLALCWLATGDAARAAGDAADHAQALAEARAAFAGLADADRTGCAETIARLAA